METQKNYNINPNQYNAYRDQQSSQQLNAFLNFPIQFESKNFNLPCKNYKGEKTDYDSLSFLPKIQIENSIQKKIINSIKQDKNKVSYIFGSQYKLQKTDMHHFDRVYQIDELSYDNDTTFIQKLTEEKIYPITFITGNNLQVQNQMLSEEIMNQFNDCIKGLKQHDFDTSFYQKSLQEQFQNLSIGLNNIDLLYLNNFRVIFTCNLKNKQNQRQNNSKNNNNNEDQQQYNFQKYIYFPKIDFTIQQIQPPFKFVSTPLSIFLAKRTKGQYKSQEEEEIKNQTIKYGYFTLDSDQRRLLPFMANDQMSIQVPLVGVWVYGINQDNNEQIDQNYIIWTLLVEYVKNQYNAPRYSYDGNEKRFLFASFNADNSPLFYEVEIKSQEENNINTTNYSNSVTQEQKWTLFKNSENFQAQNLFSQISQIEFLYNPNLELQQIDQDIYETQSLQQLTNKQNTKNYGSQSEVFQKMPVNQYSSTTITQSNSSNSSNNNLHSNSPQEQHQKRLLEESMKSAAFGGLSNNNNTLSQSNQTFNSPGSISDSRSYNQKKANSSQQEFQMSALAEKMFTQQAEQLKFLQKQVVELQQALLQQQMINQQQQMQFQQQQQYNQFGFYPYQQQCSQHSLLTTPMNYKSMPSQLNSPHQSVQPFNQQSLQQNNFNNINKKNSLNTSNKRFNNKSYQQCQQNMNTNADSSEEDYSEQNQSQQQNGIFNQQQMYTPQQTKNQQRLFNNNNNNHLYNNNNNLNIYEQSFQQQQQFGFQQQPQLQLQQQQSQKSQKSQQQQNNTLSEDLTQNNISKNQHLSSQDSNSNSSQVNKNLNFSRKQSNLLENNNITVSSLNQSSMMQDKQLSQQQQPQQYSINNYYQQNQSEQQNLNGNGFMLEDKDNQQDQQDDNIQNVNNQINDESVDELRQEIGLITQSQEKNRNLQDQKQTLKQIQNHMQANPKLNNEEQWSFAQNDLNSNQQGLIGQTIKQNQIKQQQFEQEQNILLQQQQLQQIQEQQQQNKKQNSQDQIKNDSAVTKKNEFQNENYQQDNKNNSADSNQNKNNFIRNNHIFQSEEEETTIDNKGVYKMTTDFLNSFRKEEQSSLRIKTEANKENYSNNYSSPDSPQLISSYSSNMRIPQIKYKESKDLDSESEEEEVKILQKRYQKSNNKV